MHQKSTTTNAAAWAYFRSLEGAGRKVAYWGSPVDELDWVRSDNRAAGRLATEHLLAAGYRRPCFLGALNTPQVQFTERYEGYAEAMRAAGTISDTEATRLIAVPRELGNIELKTAGHYTLEIRPERLAKNAVMDVPEVRLVPVDAK